MGIKTKILLPTIAITLIVAVAILISNIVSFSGFVDDSTVSTVDSASKVAAGRIHSFEVESNAASQSIANDPKIIDTLVRKDRDALMARAKALQTESEIDFCTVTDAVGTVIARTHAPEEYGDSIAGQTNIKSAMAGESLTAIEEGSVVRLSVRTSTPVFDDRGVILGIVSAGYRLDTNQFVNSIKEMMGCEATVVLGDERIASTVMTESGAPVIGTRADADVVETVFAGNSYSGRVDIEGRTAICEYTPLNGPDGRVLGMLFVGKYLDEEQKTIMTFVQYGSLITAIMLAISIGIFLLIVKRIVTPIHAMASAASALAAGDTNLDIQVNTNDEMRILSDAFNSMISNTRQQIEAVERIADGDFTDSIKARSEKDMMNRALEKLNRTIKAQAAEIKSEHERIRLMLDATPLAIRLWNRKHELIECNDAAVQSLGLKDKREYIDRYFELSHEYQPDGQNTREKIRMLVDEAFEKGACRYELMQRMPDGTDAPAEVTLVRILYGDEYVVAAYSRDLREQKAMIAEIEQRDYLLQTVNQAADILLRAQTDAFESAMRKCMGIMASAINADRMYLYTNSEEGGALFCTQVYEWVNNVPSFQGADSTTHVSYDTTLPGMKDALMRGDFVHARVRDLLSAERAWFEARGVLAVLVFPVFMRDQFSGFVGFDNCHSEQLCTENGESVMRSGTLLIASALLRQEYVLSLKDSSNKLEAALEEARKANSAKGDFLASMSHEMRTPLNAIIGLSEVVLDAGGMDEETRSTIGKIHNSGATLLSIINDILDISKIESGKFAVIPNVYDVPSLINDAVLQNVLRIGSKPIRFILNIAENLPARLYGDDLRVRQIINNLLSNAFKYTDEGTVEFGMDCERDGDTVWMTIRISDTGVGIRPEDIDKLFTDYTQLGATAERRASGTGLGLAITKSLAEMMDGTIAVRSEYGKGSVFTVRIKQRYVDGDVIGATVAENLRRFQYSADKFNRNAQKIRIQLPYARVLVVDDNATNLDVAKGLLKPYGLQIDCVTSGREAIRAIREEKHTYNAIFMDHMMPEMDGVEATRIIREEIGTEYAKNVPIIALTANAIAGSEKMFLSKGFQGFISKPIDIARLDAELRKWVRDKDMEKEPGASPNKAIAGGAGLFSGISIKGVDKDEAIERFGGSETAFADVLRTYAASTRTLLTDMRKDIAEGNLENYAVVVHGVKGSSFGILAREAGEAAQGLEMAAKAGDFDRVKADHAAFEKSMEALLDEIDGALTEIDARAGKPAAAAPDPALLAELRAACEAFDMDGVDKAMTRLASFRYEKGEELVAWLRDQINDMAFEQIGGADVGSLLKKFGLPGAT